MSPRNETSSASKNINALTSQNLADPYANEADPGLIDMSDDECNGKPWQPSIPKQPGRKMATPPLQKKRVPPFMILDKKMMVKMKI